MITFDNVSKMYSNDHVAVKALNVEIKKGEFFVIIGPSGCGKTTLLKMINRLIPLTEGTIWINGKRVSDYNIHELRWSIGYVLQQIALFPHMTIEENIAIVPELKKWSKTKIQKRVDELLELVGLEPEKYRQRKPKELSGGEQQRVGVLRALAADPEIILMDEPFSALDPISRTKLQDDLLDMQRKIQKTIVFVSHDMQEALKLGDRLCVMKDGEIVQIGSPQEIVENPVNEFVQQFIGVNTVHNRFDIRTVMQPIVSVSELGDTITINEPITTILEKLTEHNVLGVEEHGEMIGIVTRTTILQYVAKDFKERGRAHD
ncbi:MULTISPECIES: ABC transporter ATP-binding protein [Lysinibacillus]|jgi:osmoprotectant transport system ATP-binding protein|uniref:ABC transporter ATP-binding protein n=1 Tax=Lysinibacillus TaxID=400634 RepID=UPI0004D6FC17|nr:MULTISPECIES: ABC transporter ATP-binding protein [Lysinibacillus]AJK88309.1 glycine/betaine ABC transporter ATP-binding protein [Lysinibacillus fusiformis]KAB0442443.1 glycine/betaine ABC transporter ATP-binding protein [Lysinibacillus fusiformis]KHK49968.1 glycine/betaine ABC transporter ATP-binding protein [Lysinibacillus sp. A1]MCE4043008.1 ABC transporter ATP-binding protein [Lysinibacillus fusiformis]MCT6816336.1 ABC transporter ATP-binding protein [Lysinibacillus fusiformis]